MRIITSIQNRIYEVRGLRVMLDRDLAWLYESETKVLNLAVKRNIRRFPPDFMFQLSKEEYESLRFQFETLEEQDSLSPKTLNTRGGRGQHSKYMPYVFTEHGIAMLSGVLNSEKAIAMNIEIIRTFIELRQLASLQNDWKKQISEIKQSIVHHDAQLNQIYEALENLLDETAAQRRWNERERIGFRK
ncbi:ORF6N domain-containing protein [Pollutibacter soli]|uniref:ORF6N domain-containing protein n=1 Tax=Pollutibacter soli TaxID=3034157 RepID=UPI00301380DD